MARISLLAAATALALAACSGSAPAPVDRRVVVLGLDGMDHGITSRLMKQGELPNLARLAAEGGFRPLRTSTPPQSPTAWANFITGMRPGHHGIFDFVHRDPQTLEPYLSTSRTTPPRRLVIGSLALPLGGGEVSLLRRQRPFWSYLARSGVPAAVIRIPSHFPPRDDDGARVLSGMGTPDLLGTYGTFTLLTNSPQWLERELPGGRVVALRKIAGDRYTATLTGPADPMAADSRPLALPVEIGVDAHGAGAVVTLGERRTVLAPGEWSPFVPVTFDVVPGLYAVRGIVRLYLKQLKPHVILYVSPLNMDPLEPALPISSPPEFAAELARAVGRFYTQGMAEETKALAVGVLTPQEFLAQAHLILKQRERMLAHSLDELDRTGGMLFFYFSSTDQITHMFYRAYDRSHPARNEDDEPWADVIPKTYRALDRVVGRVRKRLKPGDLLLVMSDHGFGPAAHTFDLNGWLRRQGYLVLKKRPAPGALGHVDWSKTQAYGLGLNGLYVNLKGREANGVVSPRRRGPLLARLRHALLALRHPGTNQRVVTRMAQPDKLYSGPRIDSAPDLVVGYARGFKVSDASAQGLVGEELFLVNTSPWSGDHCGDDRLVPGILLSNKKLRGGAHRLYDLPVTILKAFGVDKPAGFVGRNVLGR
jgi:predicted AlkP superfamily phosphohydrolase/phosphomutase